MPELPRQTDVVPDQPTVPPPSLWLYLTLVVVGTSMLAVALKGDATPSDALVNLGTGLLETVAILILIDRRLRQSEVASLRGLPRNMSILLFLLWPSERQLYRYNRAFLSHLQRHAKAFELRAAFSEHSSKIDTGFVLLGNPGSGKTTWLQSVALERSALFLSNPRSNKAPILFPVRNWLPDRTLDDALLEHVSGFSPLSRRAFRKALKGARFIVILDGADEVSRHLSPSLREQLNDLRARNPGTPWTVSARPDRLTPVDIKPEVNVTPPTQEEIEEFRRRMNL